MHCADTVVSFLNDEDSWQYSMSALEATRHSWIPRRYWLRWRSILLFLIKSSVQWIIGVAVFIDVWFWVSWIPLTVATVLVLVIALMLEWMTRVIPSGSRSSTYGEFALMLEFMAESIACGCK
jgi:hypothetical protein